MIKLFKEADTSQQILLLVGFFCIIMVVCVGGVILTEPNTMGEFTVMGFGVFFIVCTFVYFLVRVLHR